MTATPAPATMTAWMQHRYLRTLRGLVVPGGTVALAHIDAGHTIGKVVVRAPDAD